ncbi:hypothetical protein SAMN02745166_00912 [Prosthecobacter debontii]|uniref:Prepilin-type N-terminal cleavage/methylation domain-containing protein n=1 Tax=Prosthecobacter debontii TaxID=48467 RepID=A0A1T4WYM6_9BACT|nr:hypothetical protein [Prosthecobacter debontii]SKA82460.1 hypothetical protein SAMN02745166_00912 [Prosthecobacter debontii]
MKKVLHRHPQRGGSLLIELSVALGVTTFLALLMMRSSLLAISGNQWTVMQTLTDAYLSRESALANRLPFAQVEAENSPWPELADQGSASEQTVTIGRLAGGRPVTAVLKRCRTAETAQNADLTLDVWRLHSALIYEIGDKSYTKSRSTLRVQ